jgi:hypothetical protein
VLRQAVGIDAAGFIKWVYGALHGIVEHERPHHVAIALDDGMRTAETLRLTGIERRVNAAKDDRRARSLARAPISYPEARCRCESPIPTTSPGCTVWTSKVPESRP